MSGIVLSVEVSDRTLALLDKMAAVQECSRDEVLARAVEKQVKAEADFIDFIQVGIGDLEAGRSISHEELVERLRRRRQTTRKAA